MANKLLCLLFCAILVTSACGWVVSGESQEFGQTVRAELQEVEGDARRSLKRLSELSDAIREDGRAREFANLCQAARNACRSKVCISEELYYSANIGKNLECDVRLEEDSRKRVESDIVSTEDLKEFWQLFEVLQLNGGDAKKHCKRVKDWVPSYGLPRYHAKTNTHELMPAVIIYKLADACGESSLKSQMLGHLTKRLSKVDGEHSVILDKKRPYYLSAFFLAEYIQAHLSKNRAEPLQDKDVSGLINSLVDYGLSAGTEEMAEGIRAANLLKQIDFAFPQLEDRKVREKGSGYIVRWNLFDAFGRPAKTSHHMRAKIDGEEKEVNGDHVYFSTDKKNVRFELTELAKGFHYIKTDFVFPATEVAIKETNIGITKGNERVKDYSFREGDSINCSQDNKIHVQFKIDRVIDPEYAAVYLRHNDLPEYDRISSGTALRFEPDQAKFIGSIDLGSTEAIHPVSGKYRLIVFLADRNLAEPVHKTIATVNIKFNKEASIKSILDSAMPEQEDIIPTFFPPRPYSMIVNMAASVALVFILITILGMQAKQRWNSHLYPTSSKRSLYNTLFIVVFLCLYALLFYYWINERFMDIVFHLAALSGIALIVGNLALTGISKKHHGHHRHHKGQEDHANQDKEKVD